MRWTKLGLVCPGEGHVTWAATHAAIPVVEPVSGSLVCVYFSARDEAGRSHIGAGELDVNRPGDGWRAPPVEVLRPGDLGTFDESGVRRRVSCRPAAGASCVTGLDPRRDHAVLSFRGLAISEGEGDRLCGPIARSRATRSIRSSRPRHLCCRQRRVADVVRIVGRLGSPLGRKHHIRVRNRATASPGRARTGVLDFAADDTRSAARA
jgi:hypothetical protein